jgi:hypothetical protein
VTAPYAFIDRAGHEQVVLNETFTVLADIGGEQTLMSATGSFELAVALADSLRAEGVAADIDIERDLLDLTATVDAHIAETGSPLDVLATDHTGNDDPSGWTS